MGYLITMNYAALLVVLAVLAFAVPVLVRIAAGMGLAQAASIAALLAGALAVLAWHLIRERVHRDRHAKVKVSIIEAQLKTTPDEPAAFFAGNEHLGDLLWRLGRRREALKIFERYLELERSRGRNLPALEHKLHRLRERAPLPEGANG